MDDKEANDICDRLVYLYTGHPADVNHVEEFRSGIRAGLVDMVAPPAMYPTEGDKAYEIGVDIARGFLCRQAIIDAETYVKGSLIDDAEWDPFNGCVMIQWLYKGWRIKSPLQVLATLSKLA